MLHEETLALLNYFVAFGKRVTLNSHNPAGILRTEFTGPLLPGFFISYNQSIRWPSSRSPGYSNGTPNAKPYSHSIVLGGLLEMSKQTRLTPLTSLMMRVESRASRSYGKRTQSAVMPSTLSTARMATTLS